MSDSPFSRIRALFLKKKHLFLLLLASLCLLCLLFAVEGKEEGGGKEEVFDERAYVSQLEERTRALLSNVEGAGEVHVMITMENSFESHYAADHQTDEMQTGEAQDSSQKESVVLQTEKNGVKSPIVKSVSRPRVRGVSIVCRGGADARVQMKILSLVSALFDLDSNQISVTN